MYSKTRSFRTISAALFALGAVSLVACSDLEDLSTEFDDEVALEDGDNEDIRVIYGKDNRKDVFKSKNNQLKNLAKRSTVALMSTFALDTSNPNNVKLNASTYEEAFGLCEGEPFANQLTAGDCSGTLIGDDLILTAGHCVQKSCNANTRFVFKYYRNANGLQKITKKDIFSCKAVVAHRNDNSQDYAIVQLDRKATPRFKPAPLVKHSKALAKGNKLAVIGSPVGLPLKITDGGKVLNGRSGPKDHFVSNLDTFGGNSGSGVYVKNGQKFSLAGILVRGEDDHVKQGSCKVENHCPENAAGCRGEDSNYAFRALDDLCKKFPNRGICK